MGARVAPLSPPVAVKDSSVLLAAQVAAQREGAVMSHHIARVQFATVQQVLSSTIVFALASSAIAAPTPSFQPLGDLPGGIFSSGPAAISANGLVVVGSSESCNGKEAFMWTV